jgi:hypothetical protein
LFDFWDAVSGDEACAGVLLATLVEEAPGRSLEDAAAAGAFASVHDWLAFAAHAVMVAQVTAQSIYVEDVSESNVWVAPDGMPQWVDIDISMSRAAVRFMSLRVAPSLGGASHPCIQPDGIRGAGRTWSGATDVLQVILLIAEQAHDAQGYPAQVASHFLHEWHQVIFDRHMHNSPMKSFVVRELESSFTATVLRLHMCGILGVTEGIAEDATLQSMSAA